MSPICATIVSCDRPAGTGRRTGHRPGPAGRTPLMGGPLVGCGGGGPLLGYGGAVDRAGIGGRVRHAEVGRRPRVGRRRELARLARPTEAAASALCPSRTPSRRDSSRHLTAR